MKKNKEFELKLLLDKDSYEKILINYQLIKTIKQINYYFDDNLQTLAKNNITLRIRNQNNINVLCIKVKKISDLINVSNEYETCLNEKEFLNILNIPDSLLNFLNAEALKILTNFINSDNHLTYLGFICNTRSVLNFHGKVIELDATEFHKNSITYELEIEQVSQEEAKKLIFELENSGIKTRINNVSKYKRFLDIDKQRM